MKLRIFSFFLPEGREEGPVLVLVLLLFLLLLLLFLPEGREEGPEREGEVEGVAQPDDEAERPSAGGGGERLGRCGERWGEMGRHGERWGDMPLGRRGW